MHVHIYIYRYVYIYIYMYIHLYVQWQTHDTQCTKSASRLIKQVINVSGTTQPPLVLAEHCVLVDVIVSQARSIAGTS